MKPPPFDYVRPASVEEALEILAEHGDEAKPLAGGQSLVPMLNLRLARPAVLVDLNDLPLDAIRRDDGVLELGALVRHETLLRDGAIAEVAPLLAAAARVIGHPAIRYRGTLGGSLAHADPTAELALVSLVLDAELQIASASSARTIPAESFFLGPYMTALQPEELILGVRVEARTEGSRFGFEELAQRAGDFALAGAACHLTVADGVVRAARVAAIGAGPVPLRLEAIEDAVLGRSIGDGLVDDAVAACGEIAGRADVHASAGFRSHLVRVAVRRALGAAGVGAEEPAA
ncbi:MAG: FAD binding domain-containing protein [Candidatus Limnocylindria bacterium]